MGKPDNRYMCCVCGSHEMDEAFDYVELYITTDYNDNFQYLGAHASCLNGVLHSKVSIEIHRM